MENREGVVLILKTFEDATKTLSGEKYCTSSLVIPIFHGLRTVLERLFQEESSEPAIKVVQQLEFGFQNVWEILKATKHWA